jgi:hypothetical protein
VNDTLRPTMNTPVTPAPRTWRRVPRALGVAFLGVLLLAGIAAAAGWLTWDGVRWPAGAADREVIVTIEDLAPWLEKPPDGRASLKKWLRFDGGTVLEYSFESLKTHVGIIFKASACPTEEAAKSVYAGASVFSSFPVPGLPAWEPAGGFAWGDESRYMEMNRDGQPAGIFLAARKGRKFVLMTVIGGVALEPAALRAAILPRLEKLEVYGG